MVNELAGELHDRISRGGPSRESGREGERAVNKSTAAYMEVPLKLTCSGRHASEIMAQQEHSTLLHRSRRTASLGGGDFPLLESVSEVAETLVLGSCIRSHPIRWAPRSPRCFPGDRRRSDGRRSNRCAYRGAQDPGDTSLGRRGRRFRFRAAAPRAAQGEPARRYEGVM